MGAHVSATVETRAQSVRLSAAVEHAYGHALDTLTSSCSGAVRVQGVNITVDIVDREIGEQTSQAFLVAVTVFADVTS